MAQLSSLLAIAGCAGEPSPVSPDGGAERGIHPLFDPRPDPMPFGAVPFPDDLYLDDGGGIALAELPGEARSTDPVYIDALRTALGGLDGFGALSPVFFRFDAALDPRTLPDQPGMTTREDASVFLVDVDPGSATPFARVPVLVHWNPDELQLVLRPADGRALAGGRRYAAVVTTAVRGTEGRPVVPDPRFAIVRDATSRPQDPLLAEAFDHYGPVLSSLATNGVRREEVAALAVFRVQTIARDLVDARAMIREPLAPPPATLNEIVPAAELDARLGRPAGNAAGLDVEGGVRHGSIGFMVHGLFEAPGLLSATAGVHGPIERDDTGALRVKRTEHVPFTIFLPPSAARVPPRVVVFEHRLGGDRSDALAVADALAAAGYAVVAADLPFHGLRSPRPGNDTIHRFTGAPVPDGFGDVAETDSIADFAGLEDTASPLGPLSPVSLRDALRQAAVELLALVRLVREARWGPLLSPLDPGLAMLTFEDAPIAIVADSLGGSVAALAATVEPDIGVLHLAAPAGSLTHAAVESPLLSGLLLGEIAARLGIRIDPADGMHPSFRPELAVVQTLLDRADPMAYGRELRAAPVHVLVLMARDDEVVNNVSTESFAQAIGAAIVDAAPEYVELTRESSPVRANYAVADGMVTRALYVYEPATHAFLRDRSGVHAYAHPVQAPFMAAPPVPVANPIDDLLAQMVHYFESWRAGVPEVRARGPE